MGYALPGTPLDIRQKARVLWQSLNLLSQCSEHVTIPHNFRVCVRALCARARGIFLFFIIFYYYLINSVIKIAKSTKIK